MEQVICVFTCEYCKEDFGLPKHRVGEVDERLVLCKSCQDELDIALSNK